VRGAVGASSGNVERLQEEVSVQTEQGYNKVERPKKALQLAAETMKLRTEGERIGQNQFKQGGPGVGPATGSGGQPTGGLQASYIRCNFLPLVPSHAQGGGL
jgi:hypothetical protein